MIEVFKKYWAFIVIAVLVATLSFSTYKWNSEKKEKERLIDQINISHVIDDIEQPGLEQIKEREKTEAQLLKNIKELEKKLEEIRKARKNKQNIEDIKNEIQKTSIIDINNFFIQRGYSTSILRR